MPSASAKLEKAASAEAADPVKQFTIIMEKKVRNLEKRKGKLDNYKNEVQNGKELNEDQKIAVSKYDQVVEVLEFAKELSKSFNSVISDCTKAQKKLAKKEQIEKQQHEIQRLHEAYSYRHILTSLADEDIRNDFLNGTNGAVPLTEQNVSELDELCKLVIPHVHSEQPDIENHFHSSAEHMFFLLEGKNKEVAGTNYKNLKELLQSIKESGYFSRSSENVEEDIVSSDDTPEVEEEVLIENNIAPIENNETECVVVPSNTETESIQEQEKVGKDDVQESNIIQPVSTPLEVESAQPISTPLEVPAAQNLSFVVSNTPSDGEGPENLSFSLTNGPLQEVLSTQGSFNFLQESQIDLESPHMDPAVVAAHPMAPPPSLNFSTSSVAASQGHPAASQESQQQLNNTEDVKHDNPAAVSVQQQIPVLPTGVTRTIAPILTSVQHNSAHDFDPTHPIQTQTFTNQSFAVMQNMIIPPAYVPVTMHHGLIPPHIASMAVVPNMPPTVTTPSAAVPIHVTVASVPVTTTGGPLMTGSEESEENTKSSECQQQPTTNGNCSGPETDASQNGSIPDKGANDSEEFTTQGNNYQYRGGYRGRNRGRSSYNNGYYRGRGGYNSGRGGYQGNPYYQRGNSYSGNNYRRNPRGALSTPPTDKAKVLSNESQKQIESENTPRGTGGDRGGNRGNNYRPQQ